jgi:hypothetical protein
MKCLFSHDYAVHTGHQTSLNVTASQRVALIPIETLNDANLPGIYVIVISSLYFIHVGLLTAMKYNPSSAKDELLME